MNRYLAETLWVPDEEALAYLPEGPWPLGADRFSWVAIQHGPHETTGSLNVFDAASGANRRFPMPCRPGFAAPTDREDVFVVGCERSLGLYDAGRETWLPFASGIDAEVDGTIINDGIVFPEGLLFGTKDLAFATPKASLYLWRAADATLVHLRDDQTCSNGKLATRRADGAWDLLDIDTPTRTLVRYRLDVEAGVLGEPELVLDLGDLRGYPDGMAATPGGRSVIIAIFDPSGATDGEARQYALDDGTLEAVWTTPGAPQVTCPRLVRIGAAVRLVLTTATENMTETQRARCPGAGHLFVGETAFTEVPEAEPFRLLWLGSR